MKKNDFMEKKIATGILPGRRIKLLKKNNFLENKISTEIFPGRRIKLLIFWRRKFP
jgi:hypothetical protein